MLILLICLLAGAALPLAFAPFGIYALAFICPAILCYLWIDTKPMQAFWRGIFFGIGFFGVGVSWVFISINTYGNTPAPISILVTIMFILMLSLFPASQGLFSRLIFRKKNIFIQCLIIFPSMWVLWELLRAQWLLGFPWLLLGYSQLHTPLHGFAPLFGVYGISLLVAIMCGCITLIAKPVRPGFKLGGIILIIGIALIGWAFHKKTWTHPSSASLKISLIQGNIAQQVKWDPKQLVQTLKVYRDLTQKTWDSHLIVWPEAAVPAFPQQLTDYLNKIDQEAKKHNAYLVTGAPIYEPSTKQFFNGLLLMGEGSGIYLKRHLVPFGEYLPWGTVFNWFINYFQVPMSNFSSGPKNQQTLGADHFTFSTFICYEIAFPVEVLEATLNKNMILTIMDDSWFGKSIALAQHLEMAQMRALEMQRYALQATNTGITAIINPTGNIIAVAPIDKTYILSANVTPMSGNTPLMKWFYYPVYFLIVLFLLLGFFWRGKKID